MTSPLGVAVGLLYIRRFNYIFLNVCPFDAGSGKVGPVNQVNLIIEVLIVLRWAISASWGSCYLQIEYLVYKQIRSFYSLY